jgi:ribosomal protein S18 acetylase RimI-like enzyme
MSQEQASTPSLRAGAAADLAALVRIFLSSRRTFIPYAPLAHGEDEIEHWLGELLARRGVTVACVGDDTIGFVALSSDIGESWIEQLYLAPGQTGLGIGGQLLAHAVRSLPRNLPIRLYTFQANDGARRFYERAGFRAVAFGDGTQNEEGQPDVLYELGVRP